MVRCSDLEHHAPSRLVQPGIRVVKLYAWDDAFAAKIEAVRKSEIGQLAVYILGCKLDSNQ